MWSRFLSTYQRFAAKRMFSRWAPIYEEEVEENAYSAADEVAKTAIKYLAQADNNPVIADIGIGTGLLAQQIYDAIPSRIIGLDFSEDMMASCAGRGITELLVKCDVGRDQWPIEDNSMDTVVSAGLLEYLRMDMTEHFFRQSARILKSGGMLVFTYLPSIDKARTVWWHGHSGSYLTSAYTGDWMESEIKAHGMEIIEHSPPFKGSVFHDGSSYDYRLIAAKKN